MLVRGPGFVAAFLFSVVCHSQTAKESDRFISQIFSGDTFNAFYEMKEYLAQQRTPLMFSNNTTATTCSDYFALAARHNIIENNDNKLAKSEYLLCDALKILSGADSVRFTIPYDWIGQHLLDYLDLRTFQHSQQKNVSDKRFTLNKLFPKTARHMANKAILDNEDRRMTFEVIANTDINKNWQDDWVVQFADEAKDGSYRDYGTLILYDVKQGALSTATEFSLRR